MSLLCQVIYINVFLSKQALENKHQIVKTLKNFVLFGFIHNINEETKQSPLLLLPPPPRPFVKQKGPGGPREGGVGGYGMFISYLFQVLWSQVLYGFWVRAK